MQAETIIITPHEGGWAVKADGVIAHVAPTFGLALATANRIPSTGEPTVLVSDPAGAHSPHAEGAATEPFGPARRPLQKSARPHPVVVTERVAIPANINGEDLRQQNSSKRKS